MSNLIYNRSDNDERYYTKTQIDNIIQNIINNHNTDITNITNTINTTKTNLENDYVKRITDLTNKHNQEFAELKKLVSDGKALLAGTITGLGVTTASTADFATINTNIKTLATNKYNAGHAQGVTDTKQGNATTAQVLSGYTFTSLSAGVNASGTMTNRGSWDGSITIGSSGTGSKIIPKGYHDGTGKVTADANATINAIAKKKYDEGYEAGYGPQHNISFPVMIEHDVGSGATYTQTINLKNFKLAGFKSCTFSIHDWQMAIGSSSSNKYNKAKLPKSMSKDSNDILTIDLTHANCPDSLWIGFSDNPGQYVKTQTFTVRK